MKIFYITRMNFLADKAHIFNTTKTCEALSAIGADVTLVSSNDCLRDNATTERFFEKHDIKRRFEVVSLNSLSNYFKNGTWRIANWLETLFVNLSLLKFIFLRRRKIDAMYFRDGSLFMPVLFCKYILRKPIFFEIHAVLHRQRAQFFVNLLAKLSNGLINISYGLDKFYKKINAHSIVSFCAAAEPEKFAAIRANKNELRQKLSLPPRVTIIGYTGNLSVTGNNDPYGVDDIIRALPLLTDHIIFVGVGKKQNETFALDNLAEKLGVAKRLIFLPWTTREKVAEYILAFDILAIPAAGAQIGNSPTKMFEYLAAGRPIIAANTEAVAEVLTNGKNAILVDYKNPRSWAEAVKKILNNSTLAADIVARAQEDAKKYTWEKRGRDIYSFIISTVKNEKFL